MSPDSAIPLGSSEVEDTSSPGVDLDAALKRALTVNPDKLSAHLEVLQKDLVVGETKTRLHCYFLPLDGNGRPRVKPLAEFLRNQIVDYAIPRRTIEEAKRESAKSGSIEPFSKLHERARTEFTHLAMTGEGGELLLFAMAEAIFGLTQVICKMSLKTSTSVHFHGADGVYAEARPDGGLNLYWGESKVHGKSADAIRKCLASLAPFLIEPAGEDATRGRDMWLVNEFANLNDPAVVAGLKRFLDHDDKASQQTRHCGIALTAFDCAGYPGADAQGTTEEVADALKQEIRDWQRSVTSRLGIEKLDQFDIHFICVPMPSSEEFRAYFLELMGVPRAA